jgi:hypothetical protein
MEPWIRRPFYKYGMLLVLAVMAVFHVWMLATDSTRDASRIGLVAVLILAVNHVVLAFLKPDQRRRAVPLQFTIIIGGLVCVVIWAWKEIGAR